MPDLASLQFNFNSLWCDQMIRPEREAIPRTTISIPCGTIRRTIHCTARMRLHISIPCGTIRRSKQALSVSSIPDFNSLWYDQKRQCSCVRVPFSYFNSLWYDQKHIALKQTVSNGYFNSLWYDQKLKVKNEIAREIIFQFLVVRLEVLLCRHCWYRIAISIPCGTIRSSVQLIYCLAYAISIPCGTIRSHGSIYIRDAFRISIPCGTIRSLNLKQIYVVLAHFNSLWYDQKLKVQRKVRNAHNFNSLWYDQKTTVASYICSFLKFQFLVVRLEVCEAIGRFPVNIDFNSLWYDQKPRNVSEHLGVPGFQFLVVRLEVPNRFPMQLAPMISIPCGTIRSFNLFKPNSPNRISIPCGTIRRSQSMLNLNSFSYFNSLWYDQKYITAFALCCVFRHFNSLWYDQKCQVSQIALTLTLFQFLVVRLEVRHS